MLNDNPRIYVACLAAYNNGHLHGTWIDADQSPSEIEDEINEMLKESPIPDAEEWAVHDYDEMPNLGEYPSLEDVANAGKLVEKYGAEAVEAWFSMTNDLSDTEAFESCYQGRYESREDFAMEFVKSIGLLNDVPETIRMYFNLDAYTRDLFIYDFYEENGHVFSNY